MSATKDNFDVVSITHEGLTFQYIVFWTTLFDQRIAWYQIIDGDLDCDYYTQQ